MNQKRSESLIKKVDTNTEFLISRLTNMIALSASTNTQEVQASEMLQIESNASMIVRLVEELLSVSRTLKENWILGQLPRPNDESQKDFTLGAEEKVNAVLKKIIQTKQFDEEVDGDDFSDEEEQEEEEDQNEEIQNIKVEEIAGLSISAGVQQSLVPDLVISTEAPTDVKIESSVKQELDTPAGDSNVQQAISGEVTDSNTIQEVKPEIPPVDDQIIENIDLTDAAGVLGDYDFDNFGSMDDQDNDIIMID